MSLDKKERKKERKKRKKRKKIGGTSTISVAQKTALRRLGGHDPAHTSDRGYMPVRSYCALEIVIVPSHYISSCTLDATQVFTASTY